METVTTVLPDGEGEYLPKPDNGGQITIKYASPAITVFESRREPGDTRPSAPHHHAFNEMFRVLEGEYKFQVAGEVIRAAAGSWVFVGPGQIHTFASTAQTTTRLLTLCMPGGIEQFFRELGQLNSGLIEPEALTRLGHKHGIEFEEAATPTRMK